MKKIFKLIYSFLLITVLFLVGTNSIFAAAESSTEAVVAKPILYQDEVEATPEVELNDGKVVIHLFASKTCGHCKAEKEFLSKVLADDQNLEVRIYYTDIPINAKLISLVADELAARSQYVPFTVIGDDHKIGFGHAETTGVELLRMVEEARSLTNKIDLVEDTIAENQIKAMFEVLEADHSQKIDNGQQTGEEMLSLPILGKVDPKKLSLPVLTLVIGLVDGFNPCAMWTLLFLISLLIGMEDRKRMWLLGITFILASGFVYFLFMSAWLNFFLFIGFVNWVRMGIGLLAVYIGYKYLHEFIVNKDGACKVEFGGRKQKVFNQLKKITYRKEIAFAVLGIVLIAFAVNLVELVCSAGLPAVYTNILSLSDLPRWKYYGYLIGYIFFFMIDDIGVFAVAMFTLKKVGLETKYARYSNLIGGVLMAILGLLLIFKPEWLMFT